MKLSLGQKLMNCKQKAGNVVSRIKTKQSDVVGKPLNVVVNPAIEELRPLKKQPRVEFVANKDNPVDSKIVSALTENISDLRNLAMTKGVNVKMTQQGKSLVINSGAVTSYVETSKIDNAKNLYDAVADNIHLNNNPPRSLLNGFNIPNKNGEVGV